MATFINWYDLPALNSVSVLWGRATNIPCTGWRKSKVPSKVRALVPQKRKSEIA